MYIEKIAFHLNRRDEVPNQDLARELAENEDVKGFDEIASYLYDKNKSVASDCMKVLYEAGYIKPELTTKYIDDYFKLLKGKNNRMVWGAMIAIWNIAHLEHKRCFEEIDVILDKTANGTLITHVTGIKVMLVLASLKDTYYKKLYPVLIKYLEECRPIDFGKRLEDYMVILNEDNKDQMIKITQSRLSHMNKNQTKRVTKAFKSKGITL